MFLIKSRIKPPPMIRLTYDQPESMSSKFNMVNGNFTSFSIKCLFSSAIAAVARQTLTLPRRHCSDDFSGDTKVISTVFLLQPTHLTSLLHIITPSVSLAAISCLSGSASYRRVVKLLTCSCCHLDALKLLDQMSSPDFPLHHSHFLNLLTISCLKAGDSSSCLQLVAKACELGLKITTFTFNNAIKLLFDNKLEEEAIFLFKQCLKSRYFHPDTFSFNIVMSGCCRIGDVHSAFGFFKEMKDFGCSRDIVSYNILIDGLCKNSEVDRGLEILKEVKVACNVKTYTSIIAGYCKMGRMDDAEMMFDEMIEHGIKPSSFTYNVLINGYGKVGNLSSAILIYEKMTMCGCPPNVYSYNSLVYAYCKSEKLDDALKLRDEMGSRGIKPNAYTYSILIDSFCKKNRLSEARKFLREMNEQKDIVALAFVYNPVIHGFCKAGNLDEAKSIVTEMEKKGCRPDKHTYSILIIGHCLKGRAMEAISLFNRMVTTGCAPDNFIINNFATLLFKSGMPNEAKRVMDVSLGKDKGQMYLR